MATGGRRHLGFLPRENAEVNKCRRIKCKYRRQTPKDPCFFHWRSLFSLVPFLAPEWILHPARPAHNRLLPLRMPPALSPLERGPCKTIRNETKESATGQEIYDKTPNARGFPKLVECSTRWTPTSAIRVTTVVGGLLDDWLHRTLQHLLAFPTQGGS